VEPAENYQNIKPLHAKKNFKKHSIYQRPYKAARRVRTVCCEKGEFEARCDRVKDWWTVTECSGQLSLLPSAGREMSSSLPSTT